MLEVHVYNSFFGDTKVDQIIHLRDIEIQENLDSFDTMEFKVDYYIDKYGDSNVKNIRDYSRVELVEVGNLTKTLFQGVVVDPQPEKNFMTIKVRDFKGLLLKKFIEGDKNYSNSNLSGIMSALLTELNGRSSGDTYPEDWQVELDAEVTGIDIELQDGDTYFDAITKLVNQVGKYWKVENGVIKIRDIVGEDKTTGENFTELLYDYKTPEENNISDYKVKGYSTISNVVRVNGVNTERASSIEKFWRLEEHSTIDTTEVDAYIDRSSEEQKEYILNIDFTRLDTPLQIGDKVAVKIDTAIDKVDFSGNLLITRRKIKYEGTDIVYTSVNISDIIIQRNEFTDNLNRYFTDVKNLKIS